MININIVFEEHSNECCRALVPQKTLQLVEALRKLEKKAATLDM